MPHQQCEAAGEGAGQPPANSLAVPLAERLAALERLDLDALRAEWRRLYRATPPVRLSRDLLLRSVAHRLQEEALGGLQPAITRRLAVAARSLASMGKPPPAPAGPWLKPGTTLVREWHGRTHTVQVLAKGFEHEGQHYASLTRLAHAITGAHWSGPRFFGLLRGSRPVAAGARRETAGADAG